MVPPLPGPFLGSAQVRALERLAIEEYGIPGFTLMRRAGEAAFALLRRLWPSADPVWVLCGGGNNGGDGYVLAALAHEAGLRTRAFHLGDPASLRGEAAEALALARERGVDIAPFDAGFAPPRPNGVLVDALLGNGLRGAVREDCRTAIEWINAARLPVMALDLPSGLCADTGAVLGAAVRASATLTFLAAKTGLTHGEGPVHAGDLHLDPLGLPDSLRERARSLSAGRPG